MASRNAERRDPVTRGTGNVFADLGFPDAAERQAKLRLAYALNQVLDASKLLLGKLCCHVERSCFGVDLLQHFIKDQNFVFLETCLPFQFVEVSRHHKAVVQRHGALYLFAFVELFAAVYKSQ